MSAEASQAIDWPPVQQRRSRADLLVLTLLPLPFAAALLLNLTLYGGTQQDLAEWLLKTQSFQWGYDAENPPLVFWLGLGWQTLFGVGLGQLLALKFILLAGFHAASYIAARRAFGAVLPALAVTAAPGALTYVAWIPLASYSHSVLLLFAMAVSLGLALELRRAPRPWIYGALGVAVAVGLLAKYNYGLFLIGLLAGLLADPHARRALTSPWLLLTVVLAAAIPAPHLLWLLDHATAAAAAADQNLTARPGGLMTYAQALLALGDATVAFALPLAALLPLWFAKPLQQRKDARRRSKAEAAGRVITWQVVVTLLVFAAIALLLGASRMRTHYLYPLVFFAWPVMAAAWTRNGGRLRFASFAAVAGTLQLVAVVALAGHALTQAQDCSRCGQHIDDARLAAALRTAGYPGGGTIVSYTGYRLNPGGSLRRLFPDARAVSTKWPLTRPPVRAAGPCLVLWPTDAKPDLERRITTAAPPPFKRSLPAPTATGRVITHLPYASHDGPALGYALWTDGPAACHAAYAPKDRF